MIAALTLSSDSRTTAGILLLTIVAVEFGGVTMLRIVRGHQPATEFQRSFARAGHAHAGVFVVFALVAQILADAAELSGAANFLARNGILGCGHPLSRRLLPLLGRPRHHPAEPPYRARLRRRRRTDRRGTRARHRIAHRLARVRRKHGHGSPAIRLQRNARSRSLGASSCARS